MIAAVLPAPVLPMSQTTGATACARLRMLSASAAGLLSMVDKLEGDRTKLQLRQLQVGFLIHYNIPPLSIVQIQHAQRFVDPTKPLSNRLDLAELLFLPQHPHTASDHWWP